MTDQAPPFVEKDVEHMVLGASLEYDGLAGQFVTEGVREPHFYSEHHRKIWRRLVEALTHELGACLPTVRMLLAQHGEIEDVGPAYLSRLVDGVPRPNRESVRALSRRLITCAVGRGTIELLARSQRELAERPVALSDG